MNAVPSQPATFSVTIDLTPWLQATAHGDDPEGAE